MLACVDIGSTYTKAALVDPATGTLLAAAQSPTTLDDVVTGVIAATAGFPDAPIVACSSAGGGLRLAVVGYEELISAEAGHRAALSAGARVVHVAAGVLDAAALASLRAAEPDVVLLVGGTDGGEASVLRANAAVLAAAAWSVPVVLAGNVTVRDTVAAVLRDGGLPVHEADNVLPDIGRLAPESARAAIRTVFLDHVIGGDRLSTDPRLRSWVRAVTPDAVLEGVTVLARVLAPMEVSVVVLDVGGATTDVYCVPDADAEQATLGREAVGVPARRRTVEGDLGVSWSMAALRVAAAAEGLPVPGEDPLELGAAAATVALRRHLRAEAAYGPGGASARSAGVVVLSGGVFRHAERAAVDRVIARLADDSGGAGSVLQKGRPVIVDRDYVLAATGLLAVEHPEAAAGLAAGLVAGLLRGAER